MKCSFNYRRCHKNEISCKLVRLQIEKNRDAYEVANGYL